MKTVPTFENELLNLEKKYWQAIKDKDVRAALALTDDPCIIAGAQGVGQIDKKSFVKIMEGVRYSLQAFEFKGTPKVRMISDTVAILAYEVHEDLIVEGEPVSIDTSDSSAWVRRDGRWLCALHTESLLGDLYGRDRRLNA